MPSANTYLPKLSDELGTKAVAALTEYLDALGDDIEPRNLHRLIIDATEAPILKHMLHLNGGSQAKTAQQMGMNRATLRTKLKRHNLIEG